MSGSPTALPPPPDPADYGGVILSSAPPRGEIPIESTLWITRARRANLLFSVLKGRPGKIGRATGEAMSETDPQELRRKAARARQAAKIHTSGGSATDYQLEMIAEKLEHQARELERFLTKDKPKDKNKKK